MKTFQIICILFCLLSICMLDTIQAQNRNGVFVERINVTNGNQLVFDTQNNISITGADRVFVLFGDGYYRKISGNQNNIVHNYPINTNVSHYDLMAFKAKKNDPIDPFDANAHTPTINYITPNARGNGNPRVNMLQYGNYVPIKLDRSWNLSPNKRTLLIISLDNVELNDAVYLNFNSTDFTINPNTFSTYNRHQSNASLQAILRGRNGFNQSVKINNFTKVANQQTHIFIEVTCLGNVGDIGNYQVELERIDKRIERAEVIARDEVSFKKEGYPHDPNYIEVDKTTLFNPTNPCQPHPIQDQLRYKVHFQNEGNDFAKDVIVEVHLDDMHLDLATINPATNIAPPIATFTLSNINLPGTNQINPATNTFYTYAETCAFIEFTIHTYGIHQVGDLIPATANITFIATNNAVMPVIGTNTVETLVTGDCEQMEPEPPYQAGE